MALYKLRLTRHGGNPADSGAKCVYGRAVKCMFIIYLYKYAYRVIHILFSPIGSDKQVDSG